MSMDILQDYVYPKCRDISLTQPKINLPQLNTKIAQEKIMGKASGCAKNMAKDADRKKWTTRMMRHTRDIKEHIKQFFQ